MDLVRVQQHDTMHVADSSTTALFPPATRGYLKSHTTSRHQHQAINTVIRDEAYLSVQSPHVTFLRHCKNVFCSLPTDADLIVFLLYKASASWLRL